MVKSLYLFTSRFPYGNSETFIYIELQYLVRYFDKVYLVPEIVTDKNTSFILPENCIVLDTSPKQNRLSFFIHFFSVVKFFVQELRKSNKKARFHNIRGITSIITSAISRGCNLRKFLDQYSHNYYYSYWLNSWGLSLTYLKEQGDIKKFICRAHGYDLYSYRYDLPFRKIIFNNCDAIFTVSKDGLCHLIKNFSKHLQNCYVGVKYLGCNDNGINPYSNKHVVVSCSSVDNNKRVSLILETFKFVNSYVEWHHFGDGPELSYLSEISKSLPNNVTVFFHGWVTNDKVHEFYKSHHVSFFINLSKHEGLPYSMIEALSYGIPIIGTKAGGTEEIINVETGFLLGNEVRPQELGELIDKVLENKNIHLRKSARNFYFNNFTAQKNYQEFIYKIEEILD
jgi:glycosyltransferase involved in cell wall biosynthesis